MCCRRREIFFKGHIIILFGRLTARIEFNHVLVRESSVPSPRIKHVWLVHVTYITVYVRVQDPYLPYLNLCSIVAKCRPEMLNQKCCNRQNLILTAPFLKKKDILVL